jgi:hypothetical protein
MSPEEIYRIADELGLPDDEREFLLSYYGSPEPRPSVPDDRSYAYHLLDNFIGFDDDYETRGEALGAGVRDTLSAAARDPVGFARAVAEGTYDLIDRGMRGEATPLEMLELAAIPAMGPMTAARGISGLADYDPTVTSIFGSRGSQVPEAQRAMDMAEDMQRAGATPEEIWRATGEAEGYPAMFLPGRGDPLFEFSDNRLRYADPTGVAIGDPQALRGRTGDIVRHDELFRHYPDMQNPQTDLAYPEPLGRLGSVDVNILTNAGPGTVRVSRAIPLDRGTGAGIQGIPLSSRPEVLAHELQHGVARLDPSVPQGFSPQEARRLYDESLGQTNYERSLFDNVLRREEEILDPLKRRLTGGDQGLRASLRSVLGDYDRYRSTLTRRFRGLEDLPAGYGSGRFGHGMYTRTPGEALARLSAARLGMMPESRVNDPAFTALRDLENLDLEALTELRSPSDVPRSFGLEPPLAGSLPVPPSVIAGIYNNILGVMVPQRQRELEAVFDNPPEGVTRTELIEQYRQMLEEDMVQATETLLRSYLQPGP